VDAPPAASRSVCPGRVHRHALKRGRYRVSVVAIDAAGNRSTTLRRKPAR